MTDTAYETGPQPEAPELPDDTQVFEDYWGVDAKERWYLPDGKQWFEFTIMNEGQKAEYQKKTSKDLRVQGRTGDALVSVDPAGERHMLIKSSVTGWYLMQKNPKDGTWEQAPFSTKALDNWLTKAPPRIVEKLEFAIRMANPWLQQEMTLEQMREQRDQIEEMIRNKERDELGEERS